jgi:arsenite methyltransferase
LTKYIDNYQYERLIMAQIERDTVHEAVREHYGTIASEFTADIPLEASCGCGTAEASASCCGGEVDASYGAGVYDPALLGDLPFDVTGLSLGCGDPVTIAGLQPGDTVLDLGSGGGIDCFLAARQVGETGYVIGVDMTSAMLEKANANKAKVGATNVEFRQGHIEDLPVEDSTIDVIMSNCVINLSPDKGQVFREAYRVLKPGGRLSISDIVTVGEFSPAMQARLADWSACVTGAIDVERYIGLMLEAGFTDIDVVDKVDATAGLAVAPGMPRVFSARIVATKPA